MLPPPLLYHGTRYRGKGGAKIRLQQTLPIDKMMKFKYSATRREATSFDVLRLSAQAASKGSLGGGY